MHLRPEVACCYWHVLLSYAAGGCHNWGVSCVKQQSRGADSQWHTVQSGELPEGVGQGTTLRQSFVGSPADIFKQLPRELRITVEDPAEGTTRVRSGPCMAFCRHK